MRSNHRAAMNETPDDSRERWLAKKAHYQRPSVVDAYDERRFRGRHESGSTERKWQAILRVLGPALVTGARVLDVPCGRGRFTRRVLDRGLELVSADLSHPMLSAACEVAAGDPRFRGAVRCDVERLPFADATFEVVMSIRFLFHVPRDLQPAILREMARVSKRHVVVDVRHTYCWTTHSKRLRAWMKRERRPTPRMTLAEIDALVGSAGLRIVDRVWLAPLFSEKMLVVCEKV
jgi:ubiquinone/menaquinone biosynthesis C-methylase UbiE